MRIHVGIAVTYWLSILLFYIHDQYEGTYTQRERGTKTEHLDRERRQPFL